MLTAEEATADGGDYHLESKEAAHAEKDVAALLIDGVDTDDMNERAGGKEDSGADGLEEEEVRALLWTELALNASDAGNYAVGGKSQHMPP